LFFHNFLTSISYLNNIFLFYRLKPKIPLSRLFFLLVNNIRVNTPIFGVICITFMLQNNIKRVTIKNQNKNNIKNSFPDDKIKAI